MRGSIRRRSENSWSIRYDGPPGPNGKRTQKEEAVHGTKRDAERLLRQRQAEVEDGKFVQRQNLTVQDYLTHWLDTYGQTNVRAITREGYRHKLRPHVYPAVGGLQLQNLRPQHLADIYGGMATRGLSSRTILHVHRVLHGALAQAVRSGVIASNPADRVTAPKARTENPNVWGVDEVRVFIDAIKEHPLREFFKLAVYTGLRRSELAGLKWREVHIEERFLSVMTVRTIVDGRGILESEPKTQRSRRRVSFGPGAATEFLRTKDRQEIQRSNGGEAWRDTGYVFTDSLGVPISPEVPTRAFKRVVQDLELPYLPLKNLRHTHATLLLLEGTNLKVVSERLGHSNIGITADIYSHVLPELDRDAANTLDHRLEA